MPLSDQPAHRSGEPVRLATGAPGPEVLFTVTYADERYDFTEGTWGRFGRDDAACEIPVWEELLGERLSRVAGELWCQAGQLWVRNLSHTHELGVFGEAGSPTWLPARTEGRRPAACSVPEPTARLATPSAGSWELRIGALGDGAVPPPSPRQTVALDPIPDELWPVAAALCAPGLSGNSVPPTYGDVAETLGLSSRQARRQVEELCDLYAPVLAGQPGAAHESSPVFVRLATLLVRRGMVTRADLAAHLPEKGMT
ncbi:hypothetical protein [Kytococcus sp. Marseille-QA3725]